MLKQFLFLLVAIFASSAFAGPNKGLPRFEDFKKMSVEQRVEYLKEIAEFLHKSEKLFAPSDENTDTGWIFKLIDDAYAAGKADGLLCFVAGVESTTAERKNGKVVCRLPAEATKGCSNGTVRCNAMLFGNRGCVSYNSRQTATELCATLQGEDTVKEIAENIVKSGDSEKFNKLASMIEAYCGPMWSSVAENFDADRQSTCSHLQARSDSIKKFVNKKNKEDVKKTERSRKSSKEPLCEHDGKKISFGTDKVKLGDKIFNTAPTLNSIGEVVSPGIFAQSCIGDIEIRRNEDGSCYADVLWNGVVDGEKCRSSNWVGQNTAFTDKGFVRYAVGGQKPITGDISRDGTYRVCDNLSVRVVKDKVSCRLTIDGWSEKPSEGTSEKAATRP